MITYLGKSYTPEAGDTVLTCLERNGIAIANSCRQGSCQSCLLKVTEGAPPPRAQVGLKDSWKRQGFVMSCVCDASQPLSLAPADATRTYSSRISSTEALSPSVVRVLLEKPAEFSFEGGQFVHLSRPSDGVSRSYSIASLPSDDYLEFHVAVYPDGALSPWLARATGEAVSITGPLGDCVYNPEAPERPLLLAGTGTGLAPLVAVLRAAVAAAHRGPIALFHGARTERDLYYWRQLAALDLPEHVTVRGVCLEATTTSDPMITTGDLTQTLLAAHPKPDPSEIYLCGHPTLVQTLRKRLYLAGASLGRMHSDSFLPPAASS